MEEFGRRREIYVAVGRYKSDGISDILCCETDIDLLSETLSTILPLAGGRAELLVLSTRDGLDRASKSSILSNIELFGDKIETQDTVIIVISCHGASLEGRTYLIPSDGDPSDPGSWLDVVELKEMIDSWDCRFKIILLDACHSGDLNLSFKNNIRDFEPALVAGLLLSRSRGIVFAASCSHRQLALIQKDRRNSVWIKAISDSIKVALNNSAGVITLLDVLDKAASWTVAETHAAGHAQTPYLALKADGFVPLGRQTSLALPIPSPAMPSDTNLQSVICQVLDAKIRDSFGHRMRITLERDVEIRLKSEGLLFVNVFSFRVGQIDRKICIVLDMLDKEVGPGDLVKVENLANRTLIKHALIIRSVPWNIDLFNCAEALPHINLFTIPALERHSRFLLKGGYVYIKGADDKLLFRANEICEWLQRQLGKVFHVALSDAAAPSYDQSYGKSSFATSKAMEAEEVVLNEIMRKIKNRDLAVDIGCGTGRHTFLVAKLFGRVLGYDFSSLMVDKARSNLENRTRDEQAKIEFGIRDVEANPLNLSPGSVSLFIASFGMGSFVEGLGQFLANLKNQLAEEGKLVISFYNKEAFLYSAPPPWRDPSLSAVLDPEREELEVSLNSSETFRIFCRSYTVSEIKSHLSGIFDTVSVSTCPIFASFLPAGYFSGAAGSRARLIISSVDNQLAKREDIPFGAYITAVCEKGKAAPKLFMSEAALFACLASNKTPYEALEHEPVTKSVDVERYLQVNGGCVAKSILFVGGSNSGDRAYCVCVISSNSRMDIEKARKLFASARKRWWFATQREVKEKFGIDIGCIPAFGYEASVKILIDRSLLVEQDLYCGSINPRRTIKIKSSDLVRLTVGTVCDITMDIP